MLGKTAGGLYWMFRNLERSENTARLLEAGFRIALTRSSDPASEWKSVVTTASVSNAFAAKHDSYTAETVVDFLLRDKSNPSSVLSVIESARTNARMVRTDLTTEVWTAVNDNWMALSDAFKRPIRLTELPKVLGLVRQQSALVRGALHGTMLRNDAYDFAQIGTAIERADNTARILDVKYYTLLPSASFVGSPLDNVQWETILRSVSAHRAFRWLNDDDMTSANIAEFLILDARFPRSLAFCAKSALENLDYLAKDYGARSPCHDMAQALRQKQRDRDIASIFDYGLHEYISDFIKENNALGLQIELDYRFNG
ncbi:alpha-E domain-containing protein [Yoonia sediminilitoris]|uniref:Putative alpha-E superfamily protein n=1 Tax=Yoonia sediminilitoris TaxID=1286148 RepID=A0A2T6K9U0_9RHOB|nr:alpha-E domain-containing protein [Yoonia sediminilitoris]PUB11578.1 putative alpha-E superfamily protein [Yoonia sediminilitoris]RCW91778.1 putative alpha-E superfamily protein [Yoonia sediminilitoris]